MFYSDICEAFYLTRKTEEGKIKLKGISIKEASTQSEIAEFFFSLGCSETYKEYLSGYTPSNFCKWFKGTIGPGNKVWERFRNNFNETEYVELLERSFNDATLQETAEKLGMMFSTGETLSKHQLAVAITKQMCAFSTSKEKKHEAESVISKVYYSGEMKKEYTRYVEKASEHYNVMKLIGGDEVPLESFFVCNTIGEKEKVFADKKRINCAYLENPSMQAIRDIFKYRKYDNLRTVLIGSGGCGKSLMLQHLFLQTASEYNNTGVFPVFLELRHFKQSHDLLSFIVESVANFDDSFDMNAANRLLMEGNVQLFLDGFDEIDPTDVDSFLIKLQKFTAKYDLVQIVITSRQNDYLTGLRLFTNLYIWPFENTQSEMLIDKILNYQGNSGAKVAVLDYINKGFLKKDGVFASHPLLLTFVALKYPQFNKFYKDHSLFYKVTFDALVYGHDDNKKPYARVFKSVDDAEQFTKVFMEFCALTYQDGVLQLDTRTFEDYFNRLESYKEFENPHKMNVKNFKHDVCSTACVMYEKEYDIYYIDPGFQECLFAEYYYRASEDKMDELVNSLKKISFQKLERYEALDMLYKLSSEKFKYKVLLPYLNEIFNSKSDFEAFYNFVSLCFDVIKIIEINDAAKFLCMNSISVKKVLYPQEDNYPNSILLNYILRDMGENEDFSFLMYGTEVSVQLKALRMPKDISESGIIIGRDTVVENERYLLLDCKPKEVYEYFRNEHLKGKQDIYLMDDKKELIILGHRIAIEGYYLNAEPDEFSDMLANVIDNSDKTYEMFLKLKGYWKKLKIEKHRSGIK